MSSTVENEIDPNDPDKGFPVPEIVSKTNIEHAPKGYKLVCGVVSGSADDGNLTLVYQLEGKEIRARKLERNVSKWNDRAIRELVASTLSIEGSQGQFVAVIWE